jgi:repressor LexA
MSESTVAERIKILVDTVAGKTSTFLKATGLTHQNLHDLTTGRSAGPSFPTTTKILSAYPQINPSWLLLGEGEMLNSDKLDAQVPKTSSYTPRTDAHPVKALSEIKVIELPHVSFKARASLGYMQLQRFKDSDLKGAGIFDTVLFRLPPGKTEEDYQDALVFDIEGDSMEPSLRDGQQVIAWPIPEGKWEYLHNCICVVDYDDLVTVKAIFKNDLNNREGLTLHATGGRGGEFTVAREHIHSIWEVREFYGIVPVRLLP